MALTKNFLTASSFPIVPGTNVTFEIEVFNQGTLDAYDVQVSDYIPEGLILADGNWEDNDFDGIANLVNPIPDVTVAEGSETVTITFTVAPDFMGSTIVNIAEISHAASTDGGPNEDDIDSNADGVNDDVQGIDNTTDNSGGDEDDHDPAVIVVSQTFDLALTKTFNSSSTTPIVPGSTVTFNITVYNQGTVDAFDVAVNDYIPMGLMLTDINWVNNGGIAELLNEIPYVAAGDDIVVPITFTVMPGFLGTTITNNAEIAFATDTDGSLSLIHI